MTALWCHTQQCLYKSPDLAVSGVQVDNQDGPGEGLVLSRGGSAVGTPSMLVGNRSYSRSLAVSKNSSESADKDI